MAGPGDPVVNKSYFAPGSKNPTQFQKGGSVYRCRCSGPKILRCRARPRSQLAAEHLSFFQALCASYNAPCQQILPTLLSMFVSSLNCKQISKFSSVNILAMTTGTYCGFTVLKVLPSRFLEKINCVGYYEA